MQAIYLDDNNNAAVIIDQTLLPGEIKSIELKHPDEFIEAIKTLRVRGAPAIGIAGAFAVYLAAKELSSDFSGDYAAFKNELKKTADLISSARPTAVNLRWAVKRMMHIVDYPEDRSIFDDPEESLVEAAGAGVAAVSEDSLSGEDGVAVSEESLSGEGSAVVSEESLSGAGAATKEELIKTVVKKLHSEAVAIANEDAEMCNAIGRHTLSLLREDMGILTHCNAGSLATGGIGTATAGIYLAHETGMNLHVYCDETRPMLQGSRLTAFELKQARIDTTLICDNMAAALMGEGLIDIVLTGADRIAANGDFANKIGTYSLAINAKYHHIPFYVCAPSSTVDFDCPTGESIPIEERDGGEITRMWFKKAMAPEGIITRNPAFDVCPAELITGIITESGILTPSLK